MSADRSVRASLERAARSPACLILPEKVAFTNRQRTEITRSRIVRGTFRSSMGMMLVMSARIGLTNSFSFVR